MENGLPFCVAEGTLQCPCLENYNGTFCDECADGYFGFPDCDRKWLNNRYRDIIVVLSASAKNYSESKLPNNILAFSKYVMVTLAKKANVAVFYSLWM